jgi:hypothetical protein
MITLEYFNLANFSTIRAGIEDDFLMRKEIPAKGCRLLDTDAGVAALINRISDCGGILL